MTKLLYARRLFLFLVSFVAVSYASAIGNQAFVISSPQNTAQIVVQSNEKEPVHIAVDLFANDVLMVSNRKPEVKSKSDSPYQIKVGTLGLNPDFDRESKASGIVLDSLKGKWESYIIKISQHKNKHILYVIGSQSRGTAFGLMELSRRIGVSPWYWWNDVQPQKQASLTLTGDLSLLDGPKVRYRGIFINDEDWGLLPWASKTYEPELDNIGPKTYAKVFELLLRLKANAIWPGMHPGTTPFFQVEGNAAMAQKYGIVVGSSHAEPMLRNNVGEWNKKSMGDFNYISNRDSVYNYWKQRVMQVAGNENIFTIGMRGIHDSRMEGAGTVASEAAVLSRVFDDQRGLLAKYVNPDARKVPQIFVPYKEVLPVYDYGLKVPEDVSLVWPDDNHGYIRRLSNLKERQRSGGAGVYYHISYWGRPHDFLWIESIPVSLIWEEMHKAYETNSKDVWIVNVGDIKANEIGLNFFLDMAWNPEQYSSDKVECWYDQFAENQFGSKYADEIGVLLKRYFQLNFSRKPEHMGWSTVYPDTPIQDPLFSLYHHGDEVQQRIEAYDKLEKDAEKIEAQLPDELKDAFFELIAYKVTGASNMNKKLLYAFKSREYAKQGRVIANQYAGQANLAFEKIKAETEKYNQQIARGKWNNIISWQPRGLPVFGMPETGHVDPRQLAAGGIVPEGYLNPVSPGIATGSLPVFNAITNRSYFIDIFSSGINPLIWKAEADQPWVKLSEKGGTTLGQNRIWVSVDWDKISSNDTLQSKVNIELNGQSYSLAVKAIKPGWPVTGTNQFIEDNGVVSMEAEHFSKEDQQADTGWKLIEGLGRESDAMGTFPVTAPPFNPDDIDNAPCLSYDFYSTSSAEAILYFYCLPNQPINADYQLRFAVSVDGGKPVVVNAALKKAMDEYNEDWQINVLCGAAIPECKMAIQGKGKHILNVTMIDPAVVLDKIEIVFGKNKDSYFGHEETKTMKAASFQH